MDEPRNDRDNARDAFIIAGLLIVFGIISLRESGWTWRSMLPKRVIPTALSRALDGASDALVWGTPDDRPYIARRDNG